MAKYWYLFPELGDVPSRAQGPGPSPETGGGGAGGGAGPGRGVPAKEMPRSLPRCEDQASVVASFGGSATAGVNIAIYGIPFLSVSGSFGWDASTGQLLWSHGASATWGAGGYIGASLQYGWQAGRGMRPGWNETQTLVVAEGNVAITGVSAGAQLSASRNSVARQKSLAGTQGIGRGAMVGVGPGVTRTWASRSFYGVCQ